MGQSERDVLESTNWAIDLVKRELRVNGVVVPIRSRAFEIIETLVKSDGEIVNKDAPGSDGLMVKPTRLPHARHRLSFDEDEDRKRRLTSKDSIGS